MKNLFDPEGALMRVLSDLFTLLKLNLLTILCSLPIVTAGAALTTLHYCLMQVVDQQDGNIVQTFFGQFKANLRSMIAPWIIIAGAWAFLLLDMRVFPAQGSGGLRPMLIPVYLGMFLLHGLCQWIFPLSARFENSTGAKFRNAALMAVGAFPRTLAMMVISAVVPFILFNAPQILPIAFLYGISLPYYLCAFLYTPVIQAQIDQKTGRNKEKPAENEDSAFHNGEDER